MKPESDKVAAELDRVRAAHGKEIAEVARRFMNGVTPTRQKVVRDARRLGTIGKGRDVVVSTGRRAHAHRPFYGSDDS